MRACVYIRNTVFFLTVTGYSAFLYNIGRSWLDSWLGDCYPLIFIFWSRVWVFLGDLRKLNANENGNALII